jgi:glycosyltransferase involved in cell wall biosynthesis
MDRLHIALCTDGVFPHALGGMQRHSRLLAEHLVRTGEAQLTVLHPHAPPVFDPALGIREVHIPPIDPGRFYLRELWRYSARVEAALERLPPGVILSQGFCVWRHARRFSGRLVVHPHGLEMFQGLTAKDHLLGAPFRMALRHIARRSSVVVSLGGRLTPILQRLVAGSDARVVVIPNAVDVPARPEPYPSDAGPLRLLFVGRFAHNKGIDVLMQVAQRMVRSDAHDRVLFELAGEGPLYEAYRNAPPLPNVRLLGRVDDEALFAAYTRCHALLLPTRFEGMPTVVLEAMARARPVLVSDVGATAELVDATNGSLLPPGDAVALHRAVMAFVGLSHERRLELGLASYRRCAERFAWPVVAGRTMALLREVGGYA